MKRFGADDLNADTMGDFQAMYHNYYSLFAAVSGQSLPTGQTGLIS